MDQITAGVIDAVRFLQKSLSNAKLYSIDHPKSQQPLAAFVEKINDVCAYQRTVSLTASFEGLSWNDIQITQESEDNKGLGYQLLREGIELLTFHNGVNLEEVNFLLGLLRMNFTEEQEETLQSLLWEAELKTISFQAIKALSESEALSAIAGQFEEFEAVERRLDNFINLGQRSRRNLTQMAGPPPEDGEDLGLDVDYQGTGDSEFDLPELTTSTPEERFWNEYFQATKEEDALDIDIMCEEITAKSDTPLLIRALSLLLLAGINNRQELPTRDLMRISSDLTEQLFSEGNLKVIGRVLREEQLVRNNVRINDKPALRFLKAFHQDVIPPARIAGLLIGADYADPEKAAAAQHLLSSMPDEGLRTTLEWGASYEYDALRHFYKAFADVVGERALRMILGDGLDNARDKILISLIRLSRAASIQNPRFDQIRAQLCSHPSFKVRQEAMGWCGDGEFGQAEVDTFLRAVVDTNPDMRNAAIAVLREKRPAVMLRALEQAIEDRFDRLGSGQKASLALAYALVADDGGLDVLESLLTIKMPLLGEDRRINETVSAAGHALLALSSPRAMDLLKKQAGSIFPTRRKKICQKILEDQEVAQ